VQKPARKVHVSFDRKTDAKTGTTGEVRGIQFVKEP
jgi:hypothetical protein